MDTNILLRSHPSDPQYLLVQNALRKLKQADQVLCIAPQNLVEYWVVATRPPENNGLGMRAVVAAAELQRLRTTFRVLEGLPGISETWEKLVGKHQVLGKQAHDANLVATMLVHGVRQILSFNGADFKRFEIVEVIEPGRLAKA